MIHEPVRLPQKLRLCNCERPMNGRNVPVRERSIHWHDECVCVRP